MRITAGKTVSAMAIAGVAVLGAQYAGAVPSAGGHSAQPQVAPVRNIAHLYTTTDTGGTGQVLYDIPALPNGVYLASLTANFFPQGTPDAPETFSCYLTKDGLMRAQSTSSSTYTSGFYVGVNAVNTIKITPGSQVQVGCGLADGADWSYGTRTLQVTITRLDGLTSGSLAKQKQSLEPSTAATR